MRALMACSVALLVTTFAVVAYAGDVQSGLQVGDSAGAFNVKDCTGPSAGKSLCYR